MTRLPTRYLDRAAVAALFGVSGSTVAKWQTRYASTHPTPEPDVLVGDVPGWAPGREAEWREWEASRIGQGAKGRPKPRRPQTE